MSPLVDEWVEKAEGDFNAAGRELRVRRCFRQKLDLG